MFIPIGLDEDEVRRTPWVSYVIIGTNVLVYVLLFLSGARPGALGFVPAEPDPAKLFTCLFVHGGIVHLAGNMIFFYVTGPFVEDAYGRVLFPILYVASGIAAALTHAANFPDSRVPVIGASGAIAGMMGAFLVRYGRRKILFYWMPFFPLPWLARQISVRAFLYLPFWFLLQLLMASLGGPAAGVAFWAHVGGFVFGALAALAIALTGIERRWIHPAIEAQVSFQPSAGLVRAIEAGRHASLEEARAAAEQAVAAAPADLDTRRYAYQLAVDAGDAPAIARHAARLLERYVEQGETGLAADLISEADELAGASLPPRFLLRAADFRAARGETRDALALYERLANGHPADPAALRALVRVASLRRAFGDAAGSERAAAQARQHPSFGPEWAAVLDGESPPPATAGYRGTRTMVTR